MPLLGNGGHAVDHIVVPWIVGEDERLALQGPARAELIVERLGQQPALIRWMEDPDHPARRAARAGRRDIDPGLVVAAGLRLHARDGRAIWWAAAGVRLEDIALNTSPRQVALVDRGQEGGPVTGGEGGGAPGQRLLDSCGDRRLVACRPAVAGRSERRRG